MRSLIRILMALVIGVGLSMAPGCDDEETPTAEELGRELGETAREVQEEADDFSEGVKRGLEEQDRHEPDAPG